MAANPTMFFFLFLFLLFFRAESKHRSTKATESMRLRTQRLRSKISPGEGTFYGPAKLGIGLLKNGYQPMDRPSKGTDKPDVVTVGIKLISLIDVSDIDQLLTIDALFQIKWTDPRLIGVVSPIDSPQRIDSMQSKCVVLPLCFFFSCTSPTPHAPISLALSLFLSLLNSISSMDPGHRTRQRSGTA